MWKVVRRYIIESLKSYDIYTKNIFRLLTISMVYFICPINYNLVYSSEIKKQRLNQISRIKYKKHIGN